MKSIFAFRMTIIGLIVTFCLVGVFLTYSHRTSPVETGNKLGVDSPPFTRDIYYNTNLSDKELYSNATNAFENSHLINTNKLPSIHEVISSAASSHQTEVVLDAESGRNAVISLDRQAVTMLDKNNKVILTTNVIDRLVGLFRVSNPDLLPIVGDKRINSIQLVNGYLVVTVGKLVVKVDDQTGQVLPLGSD